VVEELLFRIEELPIREVARHGLLQQVGYRALEDEPLGGAAFYVLLGSDDAEVKDIALGRLFIEEDHDWLADETLVGAVLELLDDPRVDRDLRDAVLWIFSQAEAFEIVAERARRLASDSSDLELAYGAAQVIVNEVAYQPKEMERLYRSSRGPVRQVAAMSLARGPTEEPLANEIVVDLRGVAIDTDLPPWVRGEAIEALGGLAKRARGRAILFELLEPEHWFFGAPGAHFQVHSLAKVISALWRVAEDPEVREKLNALYPVLERLRSGEREYVEWELDLVLGKDPGNFYGPVDPERRP
jgi:hypothetical protein